MNQQDKIELSKRVAEKYGIDAWIDPSPNDDQSPDMLWLADDDARCFRLAAENKVDTEHYYGIFEGVRACVPFVAEADENYINHEGEPEATRIAILKCLDAMKG